MAIYDGDMIRRSGGLTTDEGDNGIHIHSLLFLTLIHIDYHRAENRLGDTTRENQPQRD